MLTDGVSKSFRAEFSITKLLAIELVLLALCVLPNLPGFGMGLHYMASFYSRYSAIRLLACGVLGLLFLILLPLLFRALSGRPALEIDDDNIAVYGAGRVLIRKSDVNQIDGPDWQGVVSIRHSNRQKTVGLPVSFYRDRTTVLEELRKIAPAST